MKFTIDEQSLMRELAYIRQGVIEKKSLTPAPGRGRDCTHRRLPAEFKE